jgi:hypothetical protein
VNHDRIARDEREMYALGFGDWRRSRDRLLHRLVERRRTGVETKLAGQRLRHVE